MPIDHRMVSEWQRYCAEHPDGELVIDTDDAMELLKAFAELAAAYEGRVEQVAGVGICTKLPHAWRPGDRVRCVKMDDASNVTPFKKDPNERRRR